jgi:phosphoadenosine phosphosulfate reductase
VQDWNEILKNSSTIEILEFCAKLDGVYQMASFGLTGLVVMDMLKGKLPIIFINTMYLFPETLELVNEAQEKYNLTIYEYKLMEREQFESKYGKELYRTDSARYDYLVKVLPAHFAYRQLGAKVVLTGRRQSQGGSRKNLQICEWDAGNGIIKVNPLYNWDYDRVFDYVKANNVPYNKLHDQGFKSIGDVHSTEKTRIGESERDGRWRGEAKTECGLHEDYFKKKLAAKKLQLANQ